MTVKMVVGIKPTRSTSKANSATAPITARKGRSVKGGGFITWMVLRKESSAMTTPSAASTHPSMVGKYPGPILAAEPT